MHVRPLPPSTPPDPATTAGTRPRGTASGGSSSHALTAAGLVVAFVVLRVPTAASFLVNWDSVNFALGVESFEVEHHQPHPPGYIGYIGLTRLIRALSGAETNTVLAGISVVSAAVAPAVLYLLACRVASSRAALCMAVLFGTTPLVWYYGSVSLSYMAGGALALAVAWTCHVARRQQSVAHLAAAVVLLVLLGAIRQTDIVLLGPLVVFAMAVFPRPVWVKAIVGGGLLSAIWLTPLLWSAGGPVAYLDLSADLAELAGGRTSFLSGGLPGLGRNLLMFSLGLLFGLGVLGVLWVVARRSGLRLLDALDRTDRIFLAVWVLPSVLTFLFVHTGQLGYVLLIVPAAYIVFATVLDRLFDSRAPRERRGVLNMRPGLVPLVAFLVLLHAAVYFTAPDQAVSLMRSRQVDESAEGSGHQTSVLERIREFNVPLNDAHWRSVRAEVQEFDPATTALLAMPHSAGSFRHLSYYLPEYRVYGLGHDRDGVFGHLATAHDLVSDYSVDGLDRADRRLDLPDGIERVLVLDQPIRRRLDEVGTHHEHTLASGLTLLEVDLDGASRLLFVGTEGRGMALTAP